MTSYVSNGKTIKVTGDHPLLTSVNDLGTELRWIKAGEVNSGMYLIDRKENQDNFTTVTTMNVYPHIVWLIK